MKEKKLQRTARSEKVLGKCFDQLDIFSYMLCFLNLLCVVDFTVVFFNFARFLRLFSHVSCAVHQGRLLQFKTKTVREMSGYNLHVSLYCSGI